MNKKIYFIQNLIKKNKIMPKLSQLILLLIGLSGMTMILLTTERSQFLDAIAPAPIVFSYGRGFEKRETSIRIEIQTKKGDFKIIKMNRPFYHALKGPHHYKLMFYDFLKMPNPIKNPKYQVFVTKYLCQQKIEGSMADIVKVYLNNNLHKTYDCK